jgi:hypothetical protein
MANGLTLQRRPQGRRVRKIYFFILQTLLIVSNISAKVAKVRRIDYVRRRIPLSSTKLNAIVTPIVHIARSKPAIFPAA